MFSIFVSSARTAQAGTSSSPPEPPSDEITLIFEEDAPVALETPSEEMLPSHPSEREQKPGFAASVQNTDHSPENASLIGAAPSVATSDEHALAGSDQGPALSGQQTPKADVKTVASRFAEQPEATPERTPTFVEPKVADEMVEEKVPETQVEEVKEPKEVESPKTEVRGVLSLSGEGSLDVRQTAVGRYQDQLFKIIEIKWQNNLESYKEHIAPGLIIYRFTVDRNGKISRKRRVEMKGASQIQWGHVVRDVDSSEIPPMPKEVIRELKGQPLELTLTFNY